MPSRRTCWRWWRRASPTIPAASTTFDFAVTRERGEAAAAAFPRPRAAVVRRLRGRDADRQPFLWHSVLSPYINSGLLDPLELCRAVEARYRAGKAPLNAVEGFIRQIIGWREYVRGIYWHDRAGLCRTQLPEREARSCRTCTGPARPTCSAWPGDRPDARPRLCPSHPAADDHRQFRAADRGRPAGRSTNGIWRFMPMPMNGSSCPTRWG